MCVCGAAMGSSGVLDGHSAGGQWLWRPSQAGGGLARLCAAVNAAYQWFGEVTLPVWAHCDPGGPYHPSE